MKKSIIIGTALLLMAAACEKGQHGNYEGAAEETGDAVPVTIRFTKSSSAHTLSADPEEKINSIKLVLYSLKGEERTFESYYEFGQEEIDNLSGTIYIDESKDVEKYLISMYANMEEIGASSYTEDWALFSNEGTGDFQMYGEVLDTKDNILQKKSIEIDLVRHCSKVSVNEIAVEWKNEANRYKKFRLKGLYLMDAMGMICNLYGYTGQSPVAWYNMNGYEPGPQDALLYNEIDDIEIDESTAYDVSHTLYGYISDKTVYNSSETWAEGGTRLVIEAEFNEQPCYYAIAVNRNGLSDIRNTHFVFDKIKITRPGADKPYTAMPEEESVSVSFHVKEWHTENHGEIIID